MHLCYVEESGDSGVFNPSDSTSNPFFIVIGIFIDRLRLLPLEKGFLSVKTEFYPSKRSPAHFLDSIKAEVKGATLRTLLRTSTSRKKIRHTTRFLDACLELLRRGDARLVGKIMVKGPGKPNSDAGFYGRAAMHVCETFNDFLRGRIDVGTVIADARSASQNASISHAVFTQQHKTGGPQYPNIAGIPTFGNSCNFAMLQLADIVCSAVVFPMVADAFGAHITQGGGANRHLSPSYSAFRAKYKDRVCQMQYRYRNAQGQRCGGLLVTDQTGLGRKTNLLFL